MTTQAELDNFDKLFTADVAAIKDGMTGQYAQDIQDLLHLSGQVATEGTIAATPTETYSHLIALIQRASATNLSQSALKDRITALGSDAVSIAKRVEGLAGLFA